MLGDSVESVEKNLSAEYGEPKGGEVSPMRPDHFPRPAKTALRAGYTLAAADLDAADLSSNRQERQQDILDCVDESSRKTRKLFPW